MNILLVPKVIKNYINSFPETARNAYKYFNYDNRIVNESVDRHDHKLPYKGSDDFTNTDYEGLITYAKTLINPILAEYSTKVAHEDALHIAIRSFSGGLFDGKINTGRFGVLLNAMGTVPTFIAKKKSEKKLKEIVVRPHVLKELGLEPRKIPRTERIRRKIQEGIPHIIKEKGKIVRK